MQLNGLELENQAKRAKQFRSQHRLGNFFVIPNAWDVPSARLFEEVGFSSVATSSAGMLVSLGYMDGESIPWSEFITTVRKISCVLSVPLSVDMVSGFGSSEEDVVRSVREVIEAGAVGLNLEDSIPLSNELYDPEEQCRKITSIRHLADELGISFVINARTDAFVHDKGSESEQRLENAISRSKKYMEAGADCIYPMGLTDKSLISQFVESVEAPTNLMIRNGLPTIAELKQMGITRLSFGPGASYAAMGLLWRIGKEILEQEKYETLLDGAVSYEFLNSLAVKRDLKEHGKKPA